MLTVVILVFAAALASLAVHSGTGANTSIAATPTATLDPRLIIRPKMQVVRGVLNGAIPYSGTIYPTLPGTNTLTIRLGSGTPLRDGVVMRVLLTMPGMTMTPIHSTLTARNNQFQGHLYVPMFGVYRANLDAALVARTLHGTLTFVLTF